MKRSIIHVYGKVQMVGFRYSTLRKAEELGLTGYVQNLRDGSVEIEVQGSKSNIGEFIEWANSGPSMSEVSKLIVGEKEVKASENNFEIL